MVRRGDRRSAGGWRNHAGGDWGAGSDRSSHASAAGQITVVAVGQRAAAATIADRPSQEPHPCRFTNINASNVGIALRRSRASARPEEKVCPACGGEVERLISAPAIQFKGAGWYVNDYAGRNKAPSSGSSKRAGRRVARKKAAQKTAAARTSPRRARKVRPKSEGGKSDGGSKSDSGAASSNSGSNAASSSSSGSVKVLD